MGSYTAHRGQFWDTFEEHQRELKRVQRGPVGVLVYSAGQGGLDRAL